MAQNGGKMLDHESAFPAMDLKLAGGGTLRLPEADGKSWTIFLVYRGHW